MAQQTGQITVLKNNTVTNVEHQIRFIFTKENGERITRDTTSKGAINFDIPNGDWNVSWFAVDGDQKVLPLRAGLQLKITSTTPATALADWIYGDNTHVADPILAQWTTVLDEMKAVRDQFRDENSFVGTGKIMRGGAYGLGGVAIQKDAMANPPEISNPTGFYYAINDVSGAFFVDFRFSARRGAFRISNDPYTDKFYLNGSLSKDGHTLRDRVEILHSGNTRADKNNILHAGTATPKDALLTGNYGIGSTDLNKVDLSNFGRGLYYDDVRPMGDENYTIANIVIGGLCGSAGGAIYIDRAGNLKTYGRNNSEWSSAVILLSDKNTIIDSNGNYKPASPVVQLHHDRVEYNEDFDKDNPPQFEHLETGVYRITNVREICKDGWTYNKPLNGKSQPYFMIKYEQEDATTLLARVFERTFDKNTGEFGFGEPRDIGADERWIDFHFEVDHERIAREEAQMQKEQEEFEAQERLRKEAEEQEQAEATAAWEAEMARQEAEMIAEMEEIEEIESLEEESSDLEKHLEKHNAVLL